MKINIKTGSVIYKLETDKVFLSIITFPVYLITKKLGYAYYRVSPQSKSVFKTQSKNIKEVLK